MGFKKITSAIVLLSGVLFFCAHADSPAVEIPEQQEQAIHAQEESLREEQPKQEKPKRTILGKIFLAWDITKLGCLGGLIASMYFTQNTSPTAEIGCYACIVSMLLDSMVRSCVNIKDFAQETNLL